MTDQETGFSSFQLYQIQIKLSKNNRAEDMLNSSWGLDKSLFDALIIKKIYIGLLSKPDHWF